jgi:hypothetical protein
LGNILEYALTLIVIIFNINPLDEMYSYLKIREAMKLLFVVDVMKGDPKATPAWDSKAAPAPAPEVKPVTEKPAGETEEPTTETNTDSEGTNLGEPTVDGELDGDKEESNPNDFGNFEDVPDDDW